MIAGFEYKKPTKKESAKPPAGPLKQSCDFITLAWPHKFSPDLRAQQIIDALKSDGVCGRRGFQFITIENDVGIEMLTEEKQPVTPEQVEMLRAFCRGFMIAKR